MGAIQKLPPDTQQLCGAENLLDKFSPLRIAAPGPVSVPRGRGRKGRERRVKRGAPCSS